MADLPEKYSYLNRLHVDELRRLLESVVHPDGEEDGEYVDAILEVMREKKREDPTTRRFDVERMWREFQADYDAQSCRECTAYAEEQDRPAQANRPQALNKTPSVFAAKRKTLRRTLLAVTLVVLLAVTAIPVWGYGSIIQLVAHWTAEQFGYQAEGLAPGSPVPAEYAQLQEILEPQGISLVLPVFPEGFESGEPVLRVSKKTGDVNFSLEYKKGEDSIGFQVVQNMSQPMTEYEKNGDVQTYFLGEIECYIFSNNGLNMACWYVEDVEYSLSTSLPVSALEQIIKSSFEE